MTPHTKRLYADKQQIDKHFTEHPYIVSTETLGNPPERYIFEFKLKGLVEDKFGNITITDHHQAEIYLPADYPRRPPFCRMLSPLFHPNIDPRKICIGDHWSAGQTLELLVIRIGEMICFQSYNTKSPLNAKAAVWVDKNIDRLPLEVVDLLSTIYHDQE